MKEFEQIFAEIISRLSSKEIANASGKLLYSSRSSLERGRNYILGFNPGGKVAQECETVMQSMLALRNDNWNEYTDGRWFSGKTPKEAGDHHKQMRINILFNRINIKLDQYLCSNIVFARGSTVKKTKDDPKFQIYLQESIEIHRFIYDFVRPKTIICFGKDASAAARGLIIPKGHNVEVVTLPHFAARWNTADYVQRASARYQTA